VLIIFTGYDRVSKILMACALALAKKAARRVKTELGPPSSSAEVIQRTLAREPDSPLFFFGHGELSPKGLVGQDQTSAVHARNLNLLRNRLVVATSCYSAQSLAGAAQEHGATVIGYEGELWISLRSKDRLPQKRCVLAAAMAMLGGANASSAQTRAVDEFQKAADALITGTIMDQIIAASVFSSNALSVRWLGKNRKM
jgi:hypothetical protein